MNIFRRHIFHPVTEGPLKFLRLTERNCARCGADWYVVNGWPIRCIPPIPPKLPEN